MNMKRRTIISWMLALAFAGTTVQATILRVNQYAQAGAGYTTLQAAHNAASTGDTIYVEPGIYSSLAISKRLVIIGPGYFLGQNPETPTGAGTAKINSITFNLGSQYSMISGLTILDRITIKASYITVQKCYVNSEGNGWWAVTIDTSLTGIILRQNYFQVTYNGIQVNAKSDITICNNYLYAYNNLNFTSSQGNGTILNNVFDSYSGSLSMTLSSVVTLKNNIFYKGVSLGGTGYSAFYNICAGTEFGTVSGNQANVNMTNVFVGNGSLDGRWQLKTGSPAIAAGEGGVDCGIFGGDEPYVLSGLPKNLPIIYYLYTSGQGNATDGLQIHLKAKANN
jgi:hypothetical protein